MDTGDWMKRAPFNTGRGWAALACCLALFAFLAPIAARAGISGSKHDFTNILGSNLTPSGSCTACHKAHKAELDNAIWARSLVEEKGYFNQTSNPNYAPGFTILCYDCHDNHQSIGAVDNDPPDSPSFDPARLPQDVAFDDDMKTTVPRDGSAVTQTPPRPGYYENIPSNTSGSASTYVSGHYFKNNPGGTGGAAQGDKLPCSDCHNPHSNVNQAFIRSDLGGKTLSARKASTNMAYTYDESPAGRDNEESREFCIACHGTSEQTTKTAVAFSAVNPQYGSATIVAPDSINARLVSAHQDGKVTACTDCHKHNAISVSCSDCHGFPPLDAAQSSEYFDRALRPDTENYAGGAGAHRRHKDALGDAIFQCEICHGPDPGSAAWHNQGAGVITDGSNVNIMGLDTYWSPPGYPGAITPAYNSGSANGPAPGDGAYVFSKMGGSPQRCTGVACHGNPLVGETPQLNWTDDMIDGDVPEPAAAGEIQICKWCHDATPAMIFVGTDPFDSGQKNTLSNYTVGPGVMGNGLATTAGFGAEVNGHGVGLAGAVKAVYDRGAVGTPGTAGLPDNAGGAAKECTVCHDATYASGVAVRKHFSAIHGAASDPRDEKRLRDTINSVTANIGTSTTFPTGPDQACSACHQNGVDTVADGLDWSYHGNVFADKREGDFVRACRQCHEVHGSNWNGAGRNLSMIGKWIDVNGDRIPNAGDGAYVDSNATTPLAAITSGGGPANDNAVVFTSRTGPNSFDEDDGAYDPAADTDDLCATCHVAAPTAAPYDGTGTGGGSHAGVAGKAPPPPPGYLTPGMTDERGKDCTMCHAHDFEKPKNSATADAFMPSGCAGCHGNSALNQFWPDGTPSSYPYADDNAGAHENHVQAISRRVFGQTIAQLLADADTIEKQKQVCRYCHPDPGGVGHTLDSGDQRADILGAGAFGRFTVGAEPVPPAAPTADAGSLAYTPGAVTEGTCNNLVCHNQAATPFWNALTDWTTPVPPTNCSNTTCHGSGTYSNAHAAHVVSRTEAAGAGSGYACTECHANNYNGADLPASLQHQNGEVDMLFTNAGSLDVTRGGATVAYYDKDNSGAASPTDTGFAYKDTTSGYAHACNNVYCHGADSTWGGADTTPVWNDPGTATCYGASTCHNAYGSPYDQYGAAQNAIASGSHAVHLTQWTSAAGVEVANPRGPRLGAHPYPLAESTQATCNVCHNLQPPPGETCATTDYCHVGTGSGASLPTPTHADGRVDLIGVVNAPDDITAASLAATTACDPCHGGAVPAATAKTNWGTPAWRAPCEDCHGDNAVARSRPNIGFPPAASVDAPQRAGTNFDGSGHGKVAPHATYGGPLCVNCHAENSPHFTQRTAVGAAAIAPALGDTNRLDVLGVNDYAVAPVTYCGTCHSGAVETIHFPNTNTAGNTSNDAILCSACHDPHGQAGQDAMIVGSVAAPPRTISGFADKAARASYANALFQGVCQSCHDQVEVTTFNRATDSSLTHEPGALCTSCHKHTNTVAFTAKCYDCHGDTATGTHFYPDTASALPADWPDRAGKHLAHITAIADFSLVDSVVATDASTCVWCHPGGGHSGDQAALPADLHDGTVSHFRTIDGQADAGDTVTVGTSCNNINCHYNNTVTFVDWYGAPVVACDYCHVSGGAIAPNRLPNAHTEHVVNYGFACTQCHPDHGLDNAHENGSVQIVFDPVNTLGEPGLTLATPNLNDRPVKFGGPADALGYVQCLNTYCHGADNYEDPGGTGTKLSGAAEPEPLWNSVTVSCLSSACHSANPVFGTPGLLVSGSHAPHFNTTWGAVIGTCNCHVGTSSGVHVNGTVNFTTTAADPTPTDLTGTQYCNRCHGIVTYDTETIKFNWPDENPNTYTPGSANPKVTCESCHGGGDLGTPGYHLAVGGIAAPVRVANYTAAGHGRDTADTYAPSGRSGAGAACVDCHNETQFHLTGATGNNRLDIAGNALCNNCHDGTSDGVGGKSQVMVSTHANRAPGLPAPTPQRNAFELMCVECHDPHGTTNIYMIRPTNGDGPLVAGRWYDGAENLINFLFRGTVAFTDHSTGTSATSGVGFANTNAGGDASKICQTCHTATVHFEWNSTDTHFNSTCTGCHPHEFDSNNATADGFMPKGDCEDCHDAAASNPPALAPKVMANWTTSGHGKAGIAAECTDCHTLSLPVPDTHADDTVNSVWENGTVTTRNTNTAHLRAEYFTPAGSDPWDVQVTFDNYCWTQCHTAAAAGPRAHHNSSISANPGAPDYLSVQFGRLNPYGIPYTFTDGDRGSGIWEPSDWGAGTDTANAPFPIDCDLTTNADCSGTNYAPCISCHDPHGTNVVQPGTFGNHMLRRRWKVPADLCRGCH